jgi:hypothetical protein
VKRRAQEARQIGVNLGDSTGQGQYRNARGTGDGHPGKSEVFTWSKLPKMR